MRMGWGPGGGRQCCRHPQATCSTPAIHMQYTCSLIMVTAPHSPPDFWRKHTRWPLRALCPHANSYPAYSIHHLQTVACLQRQRYGNTHAPHLCAKKKQSNEKNGTTTTQGFAPCICNLTMQGPTTTQGQYPRYAPSSERLWAGARSVLPRGLLISRVSPLDRQKVALITCIIVLLILTACPLTVTACLFTLCLCCTRCGLCGTRCCCCYSVALAGGRCGGCRCLRVHGVGVHCLVTRLHVCVGRHVYARMINVSVKFPLNNIVFSGECMQSLAPKLSASVRCFRSL